MADLTYMDEALTFLLTRAAAGYTQQNLADATGISASKIQRLFSYQEQWKAADVVNVAEAAGADGARVMLSALQVAELLASFDTSEGEK